jgi:hypothetical protein
MRVAKIIIFFFLGLLLALVLLFSFGQKQQNTQKIAYIHHANLDNVDLTLGIAQTADERRIGLSGQVRLLPDHGLLFVFDNPGKYGIWMKDMNFPIDVIWFDETNHIIFIKNNFLPQSFPQIASPPSPALSILEVPSGFVLTHQIGIGDQIKFPK